jgi:hypothetical protein
MLLSLEYRVSFSRTDCGLKNFRVASCPTTPSFLRISIGDRAPLRHPQPPTLLKTQVESAFLPSRDGTPNLTGNGNETKLLAAGLQVLATTAQAGSGIAVTARDRANRKPSVNCSLINSSDT